MHIPDLSKVKRVISEDLTGDSAASVREALGEARAYLQFYKWCKEIKEEYVGIFIDGIVGVFLFRIAPSRPEVDEWIWVVVGDVPPAYLTCDQCPNPASALDGYIGAMREWVDAAKNGKSVAELIPVDVPATPANGEMLNKRLKFLNERVLSDYRQDLLAK